MHWTIRAAAAMNKPWMLEASVDMAARAMLRRVALGEVDVSGGIRLNAMMRDAGRSVRSKRAGLDHASADAGPAAGPAVGPAAWHDDGGASAPEKQALSTYAGREYWSLAAPSVQGSTLVIPLSGPLVRKVEDAIDSNGNAFASAYEDIAAAITAGIEDPRIGEILMVADSPGGEAIGCDPLAEKIRALRDLKPIGVMCAGWCMSAAFYLASACTPGLFMLTSDAEVGNIGTVLHWYEDFEAMAIAGIKPQTVASAEIKKLWREPLTDAQRAALQEDIDAMGQQFTRAVAAGRGVSVEIAQGWSGKHWYAGAAAVATGLADEVVTDMTAALTRLRADRGQRGGNAGSTQGAAQRGRKGQIMAITLEGLKKLDGGEELIGQIQADAVKNAPAAAQDKPASIGELKSAFAGEAEFVLGQAERGATMSQAKAAFADVLGERLKAAQAKNAELQSKIDAGVKKAASTAAQGHGSPLSLAKDGQGPQGNASGGVGGDGHEHAKGTTERAEGLIRTAYAKKADFAAACAEAKKVDAAGYRLLGPAALTRLQQELIG
ncbi:MAG: S49 family peptidase [Phycisphaerales bacterium]